jgi:hypothetical protein
VSARKPRRAMEWLPKMEELAVEVCVKFGVRED